MLALSLFSTLHLGVAMVVAFMAVIHIGMWFALRSEQANLWVGLSFAGFALLDAALAGSSIASGGELGPVSLWLVATIPTALLLPYVLLRTVWSVLALPLGRVRQWISWGVVVLVLPEAVNVVRLIATDHPAAASWEASRYDFLWAAVPYQLALATVGGVWLIEAARCLSSMPTIAKLALVANVPAVCITGREVMMFLGVIEGPTWIGLTGLPLAVFASGALVARHVKMVRDAAQPQTVDERYRRVYQLGRGGMGEVWLGVRHGAGGFRRFVVLKRIRLDGESSEAMARFVAEARVAARLHHPNIVAVHDFGRFADGTGETGWFIVMEYLAGASLYDILHRAYEEQVAIPPEVIVGLGEAILRGLDCAHGHGVLHRDISPDNVIVTFDGAVKLLDFGIAKDTRAAGPALTGAGDIPGGSAFMTVPGGVAGKRRYLAPERLIGQEAVVESDLYSLALVLLELFGVDVPETGADMAGTLEPLRDAGLRAPAGLEPLLGRALASHPKQRFRSAAAMGAELRAVAMGLPSVDLGTWVRALCPKRYEVARRLAELDKPKAEAVEAVFREVAAPTVEVSPARPGERPEAEDDDVEAAAAAAEMEQGGTPRRSRRGTDPGLAERIADRLIAVGPKVDIPVAPSAPRPVRTEPDDRDGGPPARPARSATAELAPDAPPSRVPTATAMPRRARTVPDR